MNHPTHAPAYLPRADIPNDHGFRFVGLMHGNAEELCTVSRRADGSHTLANDAFPRLISWRHLNPADTRRPLLQASFPIAPGVAHRSFALLNAQGQARAVIDCEGGKITRALMGQSAQSAKDEPAFRAFVLSDASRGLSTLQFGEALTP